MALLQDNIKPIDLSYKNNPLQVTYDIEITPDVFTLAMIHENALSLMFFGNEQFNDLEDAEILKQMHAFAEKPESKKYLKKAADGTLDFHLYRYKMGDKNDMKLFATDLMAMITCSPLRFDEQYGYKFVEYNGWNSWNYDLIALVMGHEYVNKKLELLTPQDLRDMSNIIINYHGPDWKMAKYVEEVTDGFIRQTSFNINKNLALWSNGHIDWAKLAKDNNSEDGSETVIPPNLKREMARWGLDIIIDDSVADDTPKIWTKAERDDLVDYNFNDVLGTKVISEIPSLRSELRTRDLIREMFPYTDARYNDLSNIKRYPPAERDITGPTLSSLVCIGPRRIKPVDTATVQYLFPVPDPDNPGKTKNVNIWKYMREKEQFVHPYLDAFFNHFEGKNTQSEFDLEKVKSTQPITHHSAMNMPYYRDGKPTNSFARVSTGGAHGSVMAGLHKMTDEEISLWIKSDPKINADDKPTIDTRQCIHLDWSSFYPQMATKMKLYETKEGIDRYSYIMTTRFKYKDLAEQLKEEGKVNTPEYAKAKDDQVGLKFILNGTTGAGNTHRETAKLPVDNKTLAMRLIGNMLIWCLGQRLTQAGAYIISTNTDGLYTTGLDMETVKKVVNEYVEDYGMPVDPEPIKRFINRDTSTRVEYHFDEKEPFVIGGELRHGQTLTFQGGSMGSNVAYPLIAANAVLHYMSSDFDWFKKPYDRNIIKDYMLDVLENHNTPSAWFHTFVGTKARRFTLNGIPQQKINRVLLTVDGQYLSNEKLLLLKKYEYLKIWNKLVEGINKYEDLEDCIEDKFIFDEKLLEIDVNDLEFDFIQKQKIDRKEQWVPFGYPKITLSEKAFDDNVKKMKLKHVGFRNPDTDEWLPIKAWKDSVLDNYSSNVGTVVNTAEELNNFDYSHLDIDAYVKWAEQILARWKITADIPEIGLIKYDDVVIPVVKKVRVTKKDQQFNTLEEFYTNILDAL